MFCINASDRIFYSVIHESRFFATCECWCKKFGAISTEICCVAAATIHDFNITRQDHRSRIELAHG
jgi:hypothetical protein